MSDMREFRRVLGQFATGVAVITAPGADDEPVGVTMSSFNSVSLDPPLVLFSVDRRVYTLPILMAAEGYAVNVLGRSQEHVSNRFAKASPDRWANVSHEMGVTGAPLIRDAIAHFECEPYAQHDGGDHVIFVGRVVRFSSSSQEDPLLFFRGRYHGLGSDEPRLPEWPLPMHYW